MAGRRDHAVEDDTGAVTETDVGQRAGIPRQLDRDEASEALDTVEAPETRVVELEPPEPSGEPPAGPEPGAGAGWESTAERMPGAAAGRELESERKPGAGPELEPGLEPELEPEPGSALELGPGSEREPGPPSGRSRADRYRHELGLSVVVLSAVCLIVVLFHRYLPDSYGAGSLLDTTLPWFWLPIALLLAGALVSWRLPAICVTLVAALAWAAIDGRPLLPRSAPAVSASAERLRIMSQNVSTTAPDLLAVGEAALASNVGVLALEDVYQNVAQSGQAQWLDGRFAYHVTMYEFGVWSVYPIENATPVADGTGVVAIRATVATPAGDFVLYVVHLPPAALDHHGFAKQRDAAVTRLVEALDGESAARLAVVGTFNIASTDREMGKLSGTTRLTSVQASVGGGYGFTWPAQFPMMRLDDVLYRGLTPVASTVLPETGTSAGDAHRPIYAELALP